MNEKQGQATRWASFDGRVFPVNDVEINEYGVENPRDEERHAVEDAIARCKAKISYYQELATKNHARLLELEKECKR